VDDASSKFVLQIRRPNYWRIEVPVANSDDLGRSEELRKVLSQVLLFEKTACPFQRTFTVELPEAPKTPIKKRPWKPVETPKKSIDVILEAKGALDVESGEVYYTTISDDKRGREEVESDSDATDDTNVTPRNTFHRPMLAAFLEEKSGNSSVDLRACRAVTAPPQLTILTSSPAKSEKASSPLGRSSTMDTTHSDYSSSVDSFHTVQSWHSPITPLPPSPPDSNPASPTMFPFPHDNISLPKRSDRVREMSEVTNTPETPRAWDLNPSASSIEGRIEEQSFPVPKTPSLVDDIGDNLDEEHFEIATPPTQVQRIRHRPTTGSNSRRRALSPLPPAETLFSPKKRRPRRLQTTRHLPTAIIQKTCEILLSPPSHLLHLMLDIAAKIAAGEWRGMVFGFGEGGEKIVGQWDYADGDVNGEEWGEDDFGVSLGGKPDSRSSSLRERMGRSWEVD
jgi:hypothetical protein